MNLDVIEDIVPIFSVPLSLRLDRRPRCAYLAPSREPVPLEYKGGRANLILPEVCGHAMIVFE